MKIRLFSVIAIFAAVFCIIAFNSHNNTSAKPAVCTVQIYGLENGIDLTSSSLYDVEWASSGCDEEVFRLQISTDEEFPNDVGDIYDDILSTPDVQTINMEGNFPLTHDRPVFVRALEEGTTNVLFGAVGTSVIKE